MVVKEAVDQRFARGKMLENAGLVITGRKVALVPYEREHVDKYHNWMADPWLQEMTASEPLSVEEEYAMQKSWREDPKKCTFIILEKGGGDGCGASFTDAHAIERMAGDVNLFFNDYDDPHACEIEIMVAEPKYRRQGFAKDAVQLMIFYAVTVLKVTRIYCKIHETNAPSLDLFQKLGFSECNYVAAFQEYELEMLATSTAAQQIVTDASTVATKFKAEPGH